MATPVPYSPIPTVTPRDIPEPYVHEETPIGAFGGLTAEAISSMGQATEGAGKEIFARALAMQQLDRTAAANEANANYVTQTGVKLENFTTLRGKAAVDGYDPFIADINKSREDIKSTLGDPFSQLLFEQESRRMLSWITMSAARHAGDQHTSYVLGALKASNDASDVRALGDPINEQAFQADLERKRENLDAEAVIKGFSPEEKGYLWTTLKNNSYASRFQGLAKTQPFTARRMADNAIAAGDLTGQAASDTLDYINKLRATVGARQEASVIHAGDNLGFGAGTLPIGRAQVGIKGIEGGNYNAIGVEAKSLGHALGAYQVMSANLAPWLSEAGLPAMTEAEFLKSPSVQDQLFNFKFGQFQSEGGSFNAAARKWFTGTYTPGPGAVDALGTTVPQYLAVANATLARTSSLPELQAVGDKRAQQLAPDDPMFGDALLTHIESIHQKDERVQKAKEQQNTNTVYEALDKAIDTEKVVVDFDKLKHSSPEVEAAIGAMTWEDQHKLQKDIISINNARFRQTDQAVMSKAIGLLGGSEEDRQEFLKLNSYQMPLTLAHMREISSMQRELQGGNIPEAEAWTQVQAQMTKAGIDQYDKGARDTFRGELFQNVRQWKQQHPGKVITDDDVQGIASDMLSTQRTGQSKFFGMFSGGTDLLFRLPLPDDLLAEIKKNNPNISDAELERLRQVYVKGRFDSVQKSKVQTQ